MLSTAVPSPPPRVAGQEKAESTRAVAAAKGEEASPPEMKGRGFSRFGRRASCFPVCNVVLRSLLFSSTLVAVVVMATSDETQLVTLPFPPFQAPFTAKFTYSPAFIYFIAALSVACLYSIITTLISIIALCIPGCSRRLLPHFLLFDLLLLGAVSAATGTAGTVAYIGLHGNFQLGWQKVCNIYDSFCSHIAASAAMSLFASFLLVILVLNNLRTISARASK